MPSTASQRLRVELQAIGENLNSWGDTRLNEALKRLEEANAKVLTKTVAGSNITLTSSNFIEDEARSAVIVLNGTPGATRQIIIPLVEKKYLVVNNTNASQTIGGATGSVATIRASEWQWVYCDGTNTFGYDPEFNDLKPATTDPNFNGRKLVNAAAGTATTDVATLSNKIHEFATPTDDLPMGNRKITGLATGVSGTDAANVAQVTSITQPLADAAAASASSAATSATNAANSASAAATSATNAANSATAAANSAASINPANLVPTTRTITAGTGLTGGVQDLSANRTIAVDVATSANYRAAAANKVLEAGNVWSAAGLVSLTDAATIAVDLSTGVNFTVTLGGNRTLGAPSNTKAGQTGVIYVVQDGTGGRTLAFNAVYKFAGGTAFTIDTTASRVSMLSYAVRDSSNIIISGLAGVR